MFRSIRWSEVVAMQLHSNKEYARLFTQKLIEAGEDPDEVIRAIVRAYGIKELADRTKIRPQNIVRILRAPQRAKDSTLNRLVRPFGVKVQRRLALV